MHATVPEGKDKRSLICLCGHAADNLETAKKHADAKHGADKAHIFMDSTVHGVIVTPAPNDVAATSRAMAKATQRAVQAGAFNVRLSNDG